MNAERCLANLERALAGGDAALFHPHCHWRDLLALTWKIGTVSGREAVAREFFQNAKASGARDFRIDPARTPPRQVTRAGRPCIEAIFRFETDAGPCSGVLRLLEENDSVKIWTLLTALDELKGHEEQTGKLRPSGHAYSR